MTLQMTFTFTSKQRISAVARKKDLAFFPLHDFNNSPLRTPSMSVWFGVIHYIYIF